MKIKSSVSSLAVAAALCAGTAFAEGNQRELQSEMYQEGDTQIVPSEQRPGATSIGRDPDIAEESQALADDQQDQPALVDEENPQAQVELEQDSDQQAELEVDEESDQQASASLSEDQESEQQAAGTFRTQEDTEQQASVQQQSQESQKQTVVWERQDQQGQQSQQQDRQLAQSDAMHVPPPVSEQFVRGLQQALSQQGHYDGPVDGIWGEQTYQALKEYQQEQNLQGDGQLNAETIAELDLGSQQGQQQAAAEVEE